jgi:hypothetical protein
MSEGDTVFVGSGGGPDYAYIVTHTIGGPTMVNGIPVPGGGPSSDEVLAAIQSLCTADERMCRAAFSCGSYDAGDCNKEWTHSVNGLFKNMFANEYGEAYDDTLYGPLSQQLASGFADMGMAIGAALIMLKGSAGRPAGNSVWDRLFKKGSCADSFDPNTEVLLANGTTKRIKDVVQGDRIVATDPASGETASKMVTQVHVNQDEQLALLTVTDARGGHSIVDTTQGHLFWSVTRDEWIPAGKLEPGEHLATASGATLAVVSIHNFNGSKAMHNLTVADIHTYYVLAGKTPVLVHNCGPMDLNFNQIRQRIRDHVMVNHGDTDVPGTKFASGLSEGDLFTGLVNRIDESNMTGRTNASGNHEHILNWPGAGENGENYVRVWMTPDGQLGSMWPTNLS